MVYAKSLDQWQPNRQGYEDEQLANYNNPDNDARGLWNSAAYTCAKSSTERPNLYFSITNPNTGEAVWPSTERVWAYEQSTHQRNVAAGLLWWGKAGTAKMPRMKKFLAERAGVVPRDVWSHEYAGHNQESNIELTQIMGASGFATPKPVRLIERILQLGANEDSLILDSFAGSGTTAHAVLKANAKDGGTRRFILVEGEDYADSLTAERVRRAIRGYAWVGTQRETLLEEKITLTQFKKAEQWLAKVASIKRAEGLGDDGDAPGDLVEQAAGAAPQRRRFDKIEVKIDDGVLRAEGIKKVSQRADGLGGEFSYCTLGESIELDKLLSGEKLPAFDALGAWLFYTATGGTLPAARCRPCL